MTVRRTIAVLALTSLALSGRPATAGLADLIPNLFGVDGIILAPPGGGAPSHEALGMKKFRSPSAAMGSQPM